MSKSYERCDFLIEVNPKEIQDTIENLTDFINNKLAKRAVPSSDKEGKAIVKLKGFIYIVERLTSFIH